MLFEFGVFEIGIKDVIDILLVAGMLYWGFKLLKRSGAVNLFWGILMILVIWFFVSFVFDLELTGAIFNYFISIGAIALVVIFQEELRNIIYRFGSQLTFSKWRRTRKDVKDEEMRQRIITACHHLSRSKTGALIVLQGTNNLREFEDTGEMINADVSSRLIENIFFKNTPLHDGAVIIADNKIVAAACILPVSKDTDIPTHYGLRHRAALGITEKTDAMAIIVSEETGKISVAKGSTLKEVPIEHLFEPTHAQ